MFVIPIILLQYLLLARPLKKIYFFSKILNCFDLLLSHYTYCAQRGNYAKNLQIWRFLVQVLGG